MAANADHRVEAVDAPTGVPARGPDITPPDGRSSPLAYRWSIGL
ncbi:hypothetical protein AB0899_20625 [Streptomyces sp. NPDC007002]